MISRIQPRAAREWEDSMLIIACACMDKDGKQLTLPHHVEFLYLPDMLPIFE